jgi:flagellin
VTSGAINGISADNLLGTGAPIDSTFVGNVESNNQTVAYTTNTGTGGTIAGADHQTAYTNTTATAGAQLYSAAATNATGSTLLSSLTDNAGTAPGIANNDTLTVNGKTITFQTGSAALAGAGNAYTLGIGTTLDELTAAINQLQGTGAAATDTGGILTLSTGTAADLSVTGSTGVLAKLGISAAGANTATRGGGTLSTNVTVTSATKLSGPQVAGGADALVGGAAFTASDYLIVNGKTITFNSGSGTTGTIAGNNLSIDVTTGTLEDVRAALASATGGTATINGSGQFVLTTSTGADIDLSQSSSGTLNKLGIGSANITGGTIARNATPAPTIDGNTLLSGSSGASSNDLTTAFQAGDTISVNGNAITFVSGAASGNSQISLTDNVTTLLQKIDSFTGASIPNGGTSSIAGGKITLHTGVASDLTITSSNNAALTALGLGNGVSQARGTGASTLTGTTLAFGAIGSGSAVSITFGNGSGGTVKTLNDLNNSLAADNLQASIDTSNHIVITTTNDAASQTIGTATGSATLAGLAFDSSAGNATGGAPVQDQTALSNRSNLVDQYNNILDQIKTTAQDASYNGIDLLNGDQLKLTFNETGSSTLKIQGVNFDYTGLGLSKLTGGTDFLDNSSANAEISKLDTASNTLRTEASALGSNLSIVQIRQDFSKNLINVLQTGASNLTLADTNEEAANSQALSTRQSIAVSALALANQSQQSVLQLLR